MPRSAREEPAVRVYTVCDESRYLIVRNVPALGCADELVKLFGSYGQIEEYRFMDEEDCEPFTDVYWIKFVQVSNARFAKRKLDEYVFIGNRLQVSYAPQFESLSDTKEKLEGRRREILNRINCGKNKGPKPQASTCPNDPRTLVGPLLAHGPSQAHCSSEQIHSKERDYMESAHAHNVEDSAITTMPSNQYFSSPSMNEAVNLVREKLDKIQSSGVPHGQGEAGSASKKARVDNRRRI